MGTPHATTKISPEPVISGRGWVLIIDEKSLLICALSASIFA